MIRYDYECGSCGSVRELSFRISEKPAAVACSCGGQAVSVITGGTGDSFMVDRDWTPSRTVMPGHWEYGVTAEARQRQILDQNKALRAQAKEAKERGLDRDVRVVASIPAEAYAARTREDPTYWETDILSKARKDGFDLGND